MAVILAGLALVTLQAVLTARLLGPEGYGTVAYVVSLSTIIATVSMLGTQQLAVREVAKLHATNATDELGRFLGTIRRLLLMALVLGAALWVVGTLTLANTTFPILFVALLFPLIALTQQTQGILRGFGIVALAQVPYLLIRPLTVVLVLGIATATSFAMTPTGLLATILAGLCLAAALALAASHRLTKNLPQTPPGGVGSIAQAATPFFIFSVVTLVLTEINTLMLAWWAGPEETGLFQPVARVAPVLMLSMQAIAVRLGPRISEFWSTDQFDRMQDITRKVTLATTGLTLLSAVALVVLGNWILGFFGPAFPAVSAALFWIAAAQVLNAACGPVGLLLTMTDKAGSAVWPQIVALAVNVALGAILIPGQGAIGAAMAMAGGIVVWNLAMLITVRRRMGFDPSLIGALRAPG